MRIYLNNWRLDAEIICGAEVQISIKLDYLLQASHSQASSGIPGPPSITQQLLKETVVWYQKTAKGDNQYHRKFWRKAEDEPCQHHVE